MLAKARNQNSDCALCCNPTPTEVYKHLPGFVKLLCSIDTKVSGATGTGVLVKTVSPTLVSPVLGAATATSVTLTKSNVTQGTSVSTAITSNAAAGVITTFAQSLAAQASTTFTVNNSTVSSSSAIQLTINDNGSAGNPIVKVGAVSNGNFVVKIYNAHPTDALSSAVKVHYLVS